MKSLSRFTRYLKFYKSRIVLYFFTSLSAVVFGLFSFTMLMPVLDVLFSGKQKPVLKPHPDTLEKVTNEFYTVILHYDKFRALIYAVILVVIFTILKNLFLYLSTRIINPIRNAIIRRLRDELFTKMLSLPIGFFTEEQKGDLMSRMTNDVNDAEISILNVMEVFISEPLTIIVTFIWMIAISWQLTLFMIIFLPFAGVIIGKIGKSLKRPSNEVQEKLGDMLGVIDETLAGMRVVKAFNAEKHQHLRFTQINNLIFRLRNSISARRELGSPLSEVMGFIVVSIIILYGGRLIFLNETSLTASTFLAYVVLFYNIISPFKNISSAYYNVQKGSAALGRIEYLLDVDNSIKELPDARPVDNFKNSIELRNVTFAYGDKIILNNINLTIPKGKTIALVGASGAGKSTLVDLIPRFHDVTGGELLIDGINIKEYKIDDVRRLMGVVGQEPILFNDTIYNNIVLGTGGATRQDAENAANIAHAHNFIMQKEQQYETNVGDRGSKLSGGERQRVTIARAVLKNPPILILDEATSSLDTESERMVQEAINRLMQNRTCIVIAHRLSTVQYADEIIVLEKGNIAERGTHASLLSQNGIYRRLVEMQQVR